MRELRFPFFILGLGFFFFSLMGFAAEASFSGELRFFLESQAKLVPLASPTLGTETSLGKLVDGALSTLVLPERSQVDLLVIKTKDGSEVFLPRFLVHRHSFEVRTDNAQGLQVVAPDNIESRLEKEGFAASSLSASRVDSVQLTSFKNRFGAYLLTNRSDPSSVRGEKIFLQRCVGCHQGGTLGGKTPQIKSLLQSMDPKANPGLIGWFSQRHSGKAAAPGLSISDARALESYRSQLKLVP